MTQDEELKHLRQQVTELQERGTQLVLENRALRHAASLHRAGELRLFKGEPVESRSSDVAEFQAVVARSELRRVPSVPSDEVVRSASLLLLEEVFECVAASFLPSLALADAMNEVERLVREATVAVDLIEFADSQVDAMYVAEGNLLRFGIDPRPLWRVVHQANMAKAGGPVVDGKARKPEGWTPPDIAGELRKQGAEL